MDHLILPQNPIGPLMDVPALSLTCYDNGDYFTYPERQGWGPRPVSQWQDLFEHPTIEFKAFLQRWLYYGFAYFMFGGINILEVAAVQRQSGHSFIETRFFVESLRNFLSQTKNLPYMAEVLNLCGDVQYCFREVWRDKRSSISALSRSESLLAFIRAERPANPLDFKITLSISLLWELAISSLQYNEKTSTKGELLDKAPVLSEYIARSLLDKAGWCPSEISVFIEGLPASGVIFMLNMDRPRPRERHDTRLEPKDSQGSTLDQCTQISCRHRELSQDTYRTRHVDGCLGCEELVADLSALATVLLGGNIPLISSERASDKKGQLSIRPLSQTTPYIAISHVWSDGLGNLQRNSLPECQFNRICNIAHSLPLENSKSFLIWIDTLCVPPDSANHEEAQIAALSKMSQTYENASAVLVIDSWLTSCDTSEMSRIEIMMRIFHSAWNRRLWTYPEGALAKLLFFQFQNKALDIDLIYNKFLQDRDIVLDLTLKIALNRKYWGIRYLRKRRVGSGNTLRYVIPAVNMRATSVAEDEALCLAIFLHLDVQKLLHYPRERRMEAFWSMVGEVPSDILLLNCERLNTEGLRWAPTSLLISKANFNHEGRLSAIRVVGSTLPTPVALVTSKGLLFGQSGIVFNVGQGYIGTAFMLKDNKRIHHCFFVSHEKQDQLQRGDCIMDGQWRSIPMMNPLAEYKSRKMAFISMAALDAEGVVGKRVGILAVLLHEDRGVLFGKRIASATDVRQDLSIQYVDTSILDMLYPEPGDIGEFKGIPTFVGKDLILYAVCGIEKPVTQIWCIE